MKPGIKTSEFWCTIVGSIVVATASEIGIDLDPATIASITAMIIAYGVGRVHHKNPKKNQALLGVDN